MRVRVKASGREEYGARRAGEHDDLVVAVALACWGGTKYYPGDGAVSAGHAQRDGVQSWERDMRKVVRRLVGGRGRGATGSATSMKTRGIYMFTKRLG
jgi:hypothetical protein